MTTVGGTARSHDQPSSSPLETASRPCRVWMSRASTAFLAARMPGDPDWCDQSEQENNSVDFRSRRRPALIPAAESHGRPWEFVEQGTYDMAKSIFIIPPTSTLRPEATAMGLETAPTSPAAVHQRARCENDRKGTV